MKLTKIFEPITISKTEFKNRMVVSAMVTNLNIRKGPGTNYDKVQFIPVGVYTILEVQNGKGSSAGWGRLKSGIGWVSLDFVRRLKKYG